MQSISIYFASLTWQDGATAGGVLFGVVTLMAYLDQRRAAKGQAAIIEFVKRHVDKDISEETLKQLQSQREGIEKQIKEHLPALARSAVLKEQSAAHAAAVSQHYKEWKRIQDELASSPTQGVIDSTIESIITDRLLPEFEKKEKVEKLRNNITAISVCLALSSTLIPSPLSSIIAAGLAVPLVSFLAQFYKATNDPERLRKTLRDIFLIVYFAVSVAGIVIGALFFAVSGNITYFGKIIRLIFPCVGLFALCMFSFFRRFVDSRLCGTNATKG